MNFDIGPDIEVAADEYEDQQAVLAEMNAGLAADDKPFEKGEFIKFAGDMYEVVENHGSSGTVKALNDGGIIVTGFHWEFQGEKCHRVNSCDALRIIDGVPLTVQEDEE